LNYDDLSPHLTCDEIVIDVDPPTDIAQELARLTGKRGPVLLNHAQLDQLCSYGRAVASYRHREQEILVLCDDYTQHLVIVKGASAPFFAFFPN
jgi:hypothetical protein